MLNFLDDKSAETLGPQLNGKTILLTGGTGSFGNAFVAKILANYRPKRLVVFSRDEMKQYEMEQRFSQRDYPCMRYFIGDVRDADRLEMAMRDTDIVIHAAALKHVPAAEYNPFECIRTNIHGAENVVNAAIRCGVRRVVALSTDKAVNPINLYGSSKLASDKIMIAARNISGTHGPRFCVVRYGNVLGSRGSVVPFFRRKIQAGATSLPVTDERMTRFWITLDQGVEFVLSCLNDMVGGEIFVPKIPSMKITDLARTMAPDLPQEIVGIRPGEKLHEIMITPDDARTTYEKSDRYMILPQFNVEAEYAELTKNLNKVPDDFEYSSHTNDQWLDEAGMRALLEEN